MDPEGCTNVIVSPAVMVRDRKRKGANGAARNRCVDAILIGHALSEPRRIGL